MPNKVKWELMVASGHAYVSTITLRISSDVDFGKEGLSLFEKNYKVNKYHRKRQGLKKELCPGGSSGSIKI